MTTYHRFAVPHLVSLAEAEGLTRGGAASTLITGGLIALFLARRTALFGADLEDEVVVREPHHFHRTKLQEHP